MGLKPVWNDYPMQLSGISSTGAFIIPYRAQIRWLPMAANEFSKTALLTIYELVKIRVTSFLVPLSVGETCAGYQERSQYSFVSSERENHLSKSRAYIYETRSLSEYVIFHQICDYTEKFVNIY